MTARGRRSEPDSHIPLRQQNKLPVWVSSHAALNLQFAGQSQSQSPLRQYTRSTSAPSRVAGRLSASVRKSCAATVVSPLRPGAIRSPHGMPNAAAVTLGMRLLREATKRTP
jgi:hypothetical protein